MPQGPTQVDLIGHRGESDSCDVLAVGRKASSSRHVVCNGIVNSGFLLASIPSFPTNNQ